MKISKPEYKQDVIDLLKSIIQGNIPCIKYGLCGQKLQNGLYCLDRVIGITQLRNCFRTWAYFSGDVLYPITDRSTRQTPKEQYEASGYNKYTGEYGRLRVDLAKQILWHLESSDTE